jgi:uracil-DNA glycosylase family 4
LNTFDPKCQQCPRLSAHLADLCSLHPDYWNKPVPPFGDPKARLLIVGLAPGRHGANATGRPFTGDHAGLLLYRTLFDVGLASAPNSSSASDDLELLDCRITNAVKCLPPQNKPTSTEVHTCNSYLSAELGELPSHAVIFALGTIAHRAVLRALGLKQAAYPFAHAAVHRIEPGRWLVDSYHCSRYNTQTRRLTPAMFYSVLAKAKQLALTVA